METASGHLLTCEVVLDDAQVRDLELALGGVLDDGHVLGGPVATTGPVGGPARTALPTPPDLTDSTGLLLLRDEEHTPLASMRSPRREVRGGVDVVVGELEPLRPRERRPLASARLDLSDRLSCAEDLMVLTRPPVLLDDEALEAWAARTGPSPLVVVAEGGASRDHLPARVAHAVAVDLMVSLDRPGAEVRVAPVHLRDPRSDAAVAGLLARRLGAARVLLLTDSHDGPGRAWEQTAAHLAAGSPDPLPHVHPWVEAHLRRWRPARTERGLVVLFTGLSGSGKSTLARDLDTWLQLHSRRSVTLLDGDVVRRLLSAGLGFDRASREANVRRIGWVAARIAEHGGTALCSPIAPFDGTRQEVRRMVEDVADLVLVHVSTPLAECERRDLKGLYARARTGELPEFTGISSPYEVPDDADVVVDTSAVDRQQALRAVVDHLVAGGWVAEGAP